MSETSKPEHQVRRSGLQSSEFGVTAALPLVVMAITWANKRFNLGIDPVELASMILGIAGSVVAYIHSRGQVKKSRNEASALAAQGACAPDKSELLLDVVKGLAVQRVASEVEKAVYDDTPEVLDDFTGATNAKGSGFEFAEDSQ